MWIGSRSLNLTKSSVKASRKDVRKFGLVIGGICAVAVCLMVFKGSRQWLWVASGMGFFLTTAFVGYPVLKPIYIGWMRFAFVLGWINTKLLLGIFFYLILTPTGLLMRLFGKDFLDKEVQHDALSYWKKRTTGFNPRDMERQF